MAEPEIAHTGEIPTGKPAAGEIADHNDKTEDVASDAESLTSESDPYSSDDDGMQYMDLADILTTEIENGEYTCLICTGEIGINSEIWGCNVCYRVYDLSCVKDWSLRGLRDSTTVPKAWKCPSCNSQYNDAASEYLCWCGKVPEPMYSGDIPHSCGQTCNAPLGCVHGCPSACHPGPHSECTAMGPALKCHCGKSHRQWPCVITPYEQGWSCRTVCGELLPCGEHRCQKLCHGDLCGPCPELLESRCYCGNTTENLPCSERRPNWSEAKTNDNSVDKWMGYFSCDTPCDEIYDCGIHNCTRRCHPKEIGSHQCPRAPQDGETCPCSQTLVAEILGTQRDSCQTPIPTCEKQCNKTLSCGHTCFSGCHFGECPPCLQIQPVKCGCGSQAFDVPCRFLQQGQLPSCRRKCTALRDCRRHRCNQVCCEHEQKALERERLRKKQLRGKGIGASVDFGPIEAIHRCDEVCDKVLSCGKHRCLMTCHTGPCHPCLESSLDDYICPCGQTILRAPIRCGSILPKCKFFCMRPTGCQHSPVEHECHDDSVPCPPCPYLLEKRCVCGKVEVKGVQCWRSSVSCGRACGKPLACGHLCPSVCHPEGECITTCQAFCGKLLPCGHRHKVVCHGTAECNVSDCALKVVDICACKNLSRERVCHGVAVGEPLECDESCAIAKRNAELADALGVDAEARKTVQSNHDYNEDLLDLYYMEPTWGDMMEAKIVEFVTATTEPLPRELEMPPMNSQRRMFVHLLAEEFHLQTRSLDPEPHRHVILTRTAKTVAPAAPLRKYYKTNTIRWE